jgi:hypothetical protein
MQSPCIATIVKIVQTHMNKKLLMLADISLLYNIEMFSGSTTWNRDSIVPDIPAQQILGNLVIPKIIVNLKGMYLFHFINQCTSR